MGDRGGQPIISHGVLVAVALTVTNTTKERKTFWSRMAELIESDGTRYSANAGAADSQIMLLGTDVSISARTLQPKLPERGVLLFDIPHDAPIIGLRVYESFDEAGRGPFRDVPLPDLRSELERPSQTTEPASDRAAVADPPQVDVAPSDATSVGPTFPDAAHADPACAGAPVERCRFPDIPRNESIWAYSDEQLRQVVRWVKADGQLRDGDTLLLDTMHELGFKRRGTTIVERIRNAIEAERESA